MPGDAVGAAREPRLVQEEEAQHLGAAQRDDGEVVLAEPERGQGERGTGRRRSSRARPAHASGSDTPPTARSAEV